MISAERLREVLHYDPETGVFTWRKQLSSRGLVGAKAGCLEGRKRYVRICIDGTRYYAQQLAWFYMTGEWPAGQVDHRNTDHLDNRWDNLRPATNAQNQCNRPAQANNRSGIKGVSQRPNGRWRADICIGGKRRNLGTFGAAEQAAEAYAKAANDLHGEFARTA